MDRLPEEKVVGRGREVIKAPEDFAAIGTTIIVAIARGEHDIRVETRRIVCVIVIYNIFAVVVYFYSTARYKKNPVNLAFSGFRVRLDRGAI